MGKKRGDFLLIKDKDGCGLLKRVVREAGDKIPVKRIFVKLCDITTVSQKQDENDVLLTMKNGTEYCLDNLEKPKAVFRSLCTKIAQADDDDGGDTSDEGF